MMFFKAANKEGPWQNLALGIQRSFTWQTRYEAQMKEWSDGLITRLKLERIMEQAGAALHIAIDTTF